MISDFFSSVKQNVNIIDVAKYYGINVNRNNKCLCCFHKEDTPSMSFSEEKQIFKCFGCGEGGDVINLVSKILNISPLDAAKEINNKFNLGLSSEIPSKENKEKLEAFKKMQEERKEFRRWKEDTFRMLNDLSDYTLDFDVYLSSIDGKDMINDNRFKEISDIQYKTEYLLEEYFLNPSREKEIENLEELYKYGKKEIQMLKIRCNQLRFLGNIYGFSLYKELSQEVRDYLGDEKLKKLSKYVENYQKENGFIYTYCLEDLKTRVGRGLENRELDSALEQIKECSGLCFVSDVLQSEEELNKFLSKVEKENKKEKDLEM